MVSSLSCSSSSFSRSAYELSRRGEARVTRSRSRVEPILPVARAPATTPRVRTLPSLPRRSPACPPALWRLRSPPRAARRCKNFYDSRTL